MKRLSRRTLVHTTYRYTCATCGKTERGFLTRPLAANAGVAHINEPGNSAHQPHVFTDVNYVRRMGGLIPDAINAT